MSFADAERAYLADLLDKLGPDAPTLCEGWRTEDLVAHLVIRERRPDAGPGILLPVLSGWTRRVQQQYRRRGYSQLVSLFRSGPPALSPFAVPAVAGLANAIEFFVHHEDVLRARPEWAPRELDQDVDELLWRRVGQQGRLMFRKVPVGVRLQRPEGASRVVRARTPEVTVSGEPGELVLFAFGRADHARVELAGDDLAVARLRSSPLGL